MRDPVADRSGQPVWRRVLPLVVGGALFAYVVSRIDAKDFLHALRGTNYVAFLGFCVVFNLTLLSADAMATAHVYRTSVAPVRFRELFVIRGASYLPSIVNHHVGQAWLTYFLSKMYRAPLLRVAGATLLVYATTLGALYLFFLVGLLAGHGQTGEWGVVLASCVAAAGAVYVAILLYKPRFLLERQVSAPLVEAGVRGHLVALAYRLPHVLVQFFGAWLPFWFFGIRVPLADALTVMPIIMFVVALPISPQGLGTRDALALAFLQHYAPGTPEQQASAIAATTLSWLGALTIVQLFLSPPLMKRAYALLRRAGSEESPAAPWTPRAMDTPKV